MRDTAGAFLHIYYPHAIIDSLRDLAGAHPATGSCRLYRQNSVMFVIFRH